MWGGGGIVKEPTKFLALVEYQILIDAQVKKEIKKEIN